MEFWFSYRGAIPLRIVSCFRSETLITDCPTDQAYDSCYTKINRKGEPKKINRSLNVILTGLATNLQAAIKQNSQVKFSFKMPQQFGYGSTEKKLGTRGDLTPEYPDSTVGVSYSRLICFIVWLQLPAEINCRNKACYGLGLFTQIIVLVIVLVLLLGIINLNKLPEVLVPRKITVIFCVLSEIIFYQ